MSEKLDKLYSKKLSIGFVREMRGYVRSIISKQKFEYIARQARGGKFEQPCLAGECEYVLYEQGDIYSCELFPFKLGNVREVGYDFSKIRNGGKAKEFMRIKNKCHCTHECNVRTMLLYNKRNFPKLLRDLF